MLFRATAEVWSGARVIFTVVHVAEDLSPYLCGQRSGSLPVGEQRYKEKRARVRLERSGSEDDRLG